MAGLNKGEWSEFLAILDLLENPKMKVVNADLQIIDDTTFCLKNIVLRANGSIFKIVRKNESVEVLKNDILKHTILIDEIVTNKLILLRQINSNQTKTGSFTISELVPFIQKLNESNIIKSNSLNKSDIDTYVYDAVKNKTTNLRYSIKSQMGSPATILNASSQTNIRYKVNNISCSEINIINSINSNTKLLDRLNKIEELGGIIQFDKIVSPDFNYNLTLIDTQMPEIIGDVCLRSYKENNKNLKYLFSTNNILHNDAFLAVDKLSKFLSAFSFYMKPATRWNGCEDVNGGLIIVTRTGESLILDLIYNQNEVKKYLVQMTKLDSPSSTRYNMLHLYEENGQIYFTLNLQVRYI